MFVWIDNEGIWWIVFKKRTEPTKLDICVFLYEV